MKFKMFFSVFLSLFLLFSFITPETSAQSTFSGYNAGEKSVSNGQISFSFSGIIDSSGIDTAWTNGFSIEDFPDSYTLWFKGVQANDSVRVKVNLQVVGTNGEWVDEGTVGTDSVTTIVEFTDSITKTGSQYRFEIIGLAAASGGNDSNGRNTRVYGTAVFRKK